MNTVSLTTPMGSIAIREQNGAIVQIDLTPSPHAGNECHSPLLDQAKRELAEYFAGQREAFSFSWRLTGVHPFTERVLSALSKVPFGITITYGQLAALAGNKKASRAAGQAVHRNPLPIVIPCHRVLASNGRLGGFASGLPWKKFLLAVESKDDKFSYFPFKKRMKYGDSGFF